MQFYAKNLHFYAQTCILASVPEKSRRTGFMIFERRRNFIRSEKWGGDLRAEEISKSEKRTAKGAADKTAALCMYSEGTNKTDKRYPMNETKERYLCCDTSVPEQWI